MRRRRRAFNDAAVATAVAVLALVLATHSARSQPRESAAAPAPAPVAQLGVEIPTLGGGNWWTVLRPHYISPENMQDIRDNLHASYVRTGWIPSRLRHEIRWRREDDGMDVICASGLHLMAIVPSLNDDDLGEDDLVENVREFFARYTQRDPGCIRYAEVANEADLQINRFPDVEAYAAYYGKVAPIVASFGIPVITSGVSGKDLPWTYALARLLRDADATVDGYGFHPYGVAIAGLAGATNAIARAAAVRPNASLPSVYVTEIGQTDARDLYATIVDLARLTPAITIYEYAAQPGEDPRYGLKNNPALYAAMQRAWSALHGEAASAPFGASRSKATERRTLRRRVPAAAFLRRASPVRRRPSTAK